MTDEEALKEIDRQLRVESEELRVDVSRRRSAVAKLRKVRNIRETSEVFKLDGLKLENNEVRND